MSSRGYTVLGWITWKLLKLKFGGSRSKIAAAAVVAGVVLAGIELARRDDD